jgi:hypothetical protein
VVQVIFPFKWNVEAKSTVGMKRRDAHLALAAAQNAFEAAVREGRVCRAPERMIHAATSMQSVRSPLVSLAPLPAG